MNPIPTMYPVLPGTMYRYTTNAGSITSATCDMHNLCFVGFLDDSSGIQKEESIILENRAGIIQETLVIAAAGFDCYFNHSCGEAHQ
mgnify:CR=1 FL=1